MMWSARCVLPVLEADRDRDTGLWPEVRDTMRNIGRTTTRSFRCCQASGEAARRARLPGGLSPQQAIDAVVRSANRALLLVAGGEKAGDPAMLDRARQSMEAGATGLIFGRNVWQRSHEESLRFVGQLREILARYPT
jgi:hypothetical protein